MTLPSADDPLFSRTAPPAATAAAQREPALPLDNLPEQEIDVWWGGYDPWTMLPSLTVCLLLTIGIVGLAVYLWGELVLSASLARWTSYYLVAGLWLVQLLRWLYCVAGFNYRLTTQRLYCWRGKLLPVEVPLELAVVRCVQVVQSPLQVWLGIGSIVIASSDRLEHLILTGVRQPHVIAAEIESCVRRVRRE